MANSPRAARSTSVGRRFSRFVLVAVTSLVASEIALVVFLDVVHLTSGVSGVSAAIVGAAVSYVLSRWAWERKGRPQLLRETLPFWLVSVGAWIVLGLATHLGVALAKTMQVHGFKKYRWWSAASISWPTASRSRPGS